MTFLNCSVQSYGFNSIRAGVDWNHLDETIKKIDNDVFEYSLSEKQTSKMKFIAQKTLIDFIEVDCAKKLCALLFKVD